jgi:hypothetical protein
VHKTVLVVLQVWQRKRTVCGLEALGVLSRTPTAVAVAVQLAIDTLGCVLAMVDACLR